MNRRDFFRQSALVAIGATALRNLLPRPKQLEPEPKTGVWYREDFASITDNFGNTYTQVWTTRADGEPLLYVARIPT